MLVTAAASEACRSCTALTDERWRELPLSETIPSATIAKHASIWRVDEHIEVRRCRGCGKPIARKVRIAT